LTGGTFEAAFAGRTSCRNGTNLGAGSIQDGNVGRPSANVLVIAPSGRLVG
jgi:hypothetical protein